MKTKLLVLLTTLAIAAMIGPSSANADQITLGDSCTGTLSLTSNPPPVLGGAVSNCAANWEQGATNTSIGVWGYDSSSSTFTVTGQGAYSTWGLTGTVNWTELGSIFGPSCFTAICGDLSVSSVNGFNNEFVQGGSYFIDLGFAPGSTVNSLTVSSGEVLVPEPGSLMLFGTGLLGMAGFLRRKLFS